MSIPTVATVRSLSAGDAMLDSAVNVGGYLPDAQVELMIRRATNIIRGLGDFDTELDGWDQAESDAHVLLVQHMARNPTNAESIAVGGKSESFRGLNAIALDVLGGFQVRRVRIMRGRFA